MKFLVVESDVIASRAMTKMLLNRNHFTTLILFAAVFCKHMHIAFTHDFPFTIKRSYESRVFIHADHALSILELLLHGKDHRLLYSRNGVKVRDNELSRENTKTFLCARKAKAGHTLAQDHCTRRAACIDGTTLPGALGSLPGTGIL